MAWVGAHFGWVMSTQGTSVFRQGHTAMTIIDKSVRNDDFRAFKIFLNFLNCGTEIKIQKTLCVVRGMSSDTGGVAALEILLVKHHRHAGGLGGSLEPLVGGHGTAAAKLKPSDGDVKPADENPVLGYVYTGNISFPTRPHSNDHHRQISTERRFPSLQNSPEFSQLWDRNQNPKNHVCAETSEFNSPPSFRNTVDKFLRREYTAVLQIQLLRVYRQGRVVAIPLQTELDVVPLTDFRQLFGSRRFPYFFRYMKKRIAVDFL